MSSYSNDRYEQSGGRCRGCRKPIEQCRCDSWNGPAPEPAPRDFTFSYFDFGVRKVVYGGAMTKAKAEGWARSLQAARAKGRRVAQAGTVKVLRRLPVVQHVCTSPREYHYEPTPRLVTRWSEKGGK